MRHRGRSQDGESRRTTSDVRPTAVDCRCLLDIYGVGVKGKIRGGWGGGFPNVAGGGRPVDRGCGMLRADQVAVVVASLMAGVSVRATARACGVARGSVARVAAGDRRCRGNGVGGADGEGVWRACVCCGRFGPAPCVACRGRLVAVGTRRGGESADDGDLSLRLRGGAYERYLLVRAVRIEREELAAEVVWPRYGGRGVRVG
jgi:hypothetical protein